MACLRPGDGSSLVRKALWLVGEGGGLWDLRWGLGLSAGFLCSEYSEAGQEVRQGWPNLCARLLLAVTGKIFSQLREVSITVPRPDSTVIHTRIPMFQISEDELTGPSCGFISTVLLWTDSLIHHKLWAGELVVEKPAWGHPLLVSVPVDVVGVLINNITRDYNRWPSLPGDWYLPPFQVGRYLSGCYGNNKI